MSISTQVNRIEALLERVSKMNSEGIESLTTSIESCTTQMFALRHAKNTETQQLQQLTSSRIQNQDRAQAIRELEGRIEEIQRTLVRCAKDHLTMQASLDKILELEDLCNSTQKFLGEANKLVRTIQEKNRIIQEKDRIIQEKDRVIQKKEDAIRAKIIDIIRLEMKFQNEIPNQAKLAQFERQVEEQKNIIAELYAKLQNERKKSSSQNN